MRPGQTSRPHGRNNGNNPYRDRQQIPHGSQTLDSNGPNVKIRGNPHQIFDRYVMKAANEGHQQRATRPSAQTDLQTEMSEAEGSEIDGPARASPSQRQPHSS
jgi:Domain of unknown function (DUF4167)